MKHRVRLAIVVSHPIQYHAPLYRRLAVSDVVDPEVLFLSDHGVEPSFDAEFGREIAFDVPLLDGYRHRFLPNRSPAPSLGRPWGLVNPRLLAAITRRRFDAVLVHGWFHLSEILAILAASTQRIPYLIRGESRADRDASTLMARRFAKRALLGPLVRHAAACLAIGALNRAFYLSYGSRPERIFPAPYSVDNDLFAASGEQGRRSRDEHLRAIRLDPELPVILFAAKLQPWKRPLDLVEAARLMRVPANLVMVGDGPLRPQLEEQLARNSRARVVGFVNQREIGEWYGLADLFVLPSEHEPWGLAVNEAMAAGAIPVVSDAVGCGPDLVTPDTGFVVPTGDVRSLAETLDRALSSPERLATLRRSGARRIRAFGIEATARGIEEAAISVTQTRARV